jgi:hypothetical protein
VCICQKNLRLRRWTGVHWATGLYGKMEKKFGKKMIKHQKTNILPLRWIGNLCGEFAGNHLVKAIDLDEDDNLGFKFKYHSKMWKYLNKPYERWGTFYLLQENYFKSKDN